VLPGVDGFGLCPCGWLGRAGVCGFVPGVSVPPGVFVVPGVGEVVLGAGAAGPGVGDAVPGRGAAVPEFGVVEPGVPVRPGLEVVPGACAGGEAGLPPV
jgi:hypothetical protein